MIKSFVVQNFYYTYPLYEKTQRHIYTILYLTTHLNLLSSITAFNTSSVFYTNYFNIFVYYKYSLFKFINITTTKTIISLKHKLLKKISQIFTNILKKPTPNTPTQNNLITPYYKVIKMFWYPFYKNKLNKILYINMYLLISYHFSYINTYFIKTPVFPVNTNLSLISFLNIFYLKIRNF